MTAIKSRHVLPLALAAGLILPAGADAATFCVNNPSCPAGGTTFNDVQSALTAARNNVSADEVLLGAGTYSGSFTYESNEKLTLRGTSRAATILRNTSGAVLTLKGDQATATNLRIESEGTYGAMLRRGHLDAVTVSAEGANTSGVLAYGGSSVHDSTVLSDNADALTLADEAATDETIVTESSLYGSSAAVREQSTVPLNVAIRSSTLRGSTPLIFSNGSLDLMSSVLRTATGGTTGASLGAGSDVRATNVTADGDGGGTGFKIATNGAADAKLDITSSIVTRYERGFSRIGAGGYDADVDVRYTLFQGLQESGDGAVTQANNPAWQTPPFVNGNSPIPNHQLVAPSTLAIDAGEPGLGTGNLDAAGRPRLIDGDGTGGARVDLGAYEYQRTAPVASVSGPTTVNPNQSFTLTASATDADPTETGKLTYQWALGDSIKSGKAITHSYLTPGTRTVTLSVTDPGGRITQVPHQIVVTDPNAGGGGGGGQGGDGGQGGGGNGGGGGQVIEQAVRDRIAPRLAKFGPSARRLRMSRTVSKRVNRSRGGQLRLRLSEAANVRLTFERKRGKRYRKAKGTFTISAARGLNRIQFGGRLSKKRSLGAGTYRVTAVAVDAAGNRSRRIRTVVTLVR